MQPKQYRNITISGNAIEGEHNGYGDWMKFSADVDMLKINHAVTYGPKETRNQIWSIQDGFGIPGSNAGDWSGIRDSSDEAKVEMLAIAEKWYGSKPWPWQLNG